LLCRQLSFTVSDFGSVSDSAQCVGLHGTTKLRVNQTSGEASCLPTKRQGCAPTARRFRAAGVQNVARFEGLRRQGSVSTSEAFATVARKFRAFAAVVSVKRVAFPKG